MKTTTLSIIVAVALIGGAFLLTRSDSQQDTTVVANNVTMVDGKQIIEIRAKGNYSPRRSIAKAGIPTVLKFETNGTFDCTSIVRIPSMNLTKNLPPSGATDIDLGNPKLGTLQGTCGMGMYSFQIDFQS